MVFNSNTQSVARLLVRKEREIVTAIVRSQLLLHLEIVLSSTLDTLVAKAFLNVVPR